MRAAGSGARPRQPKGTDGSEQAVSPTRRRPGGRVRWWVAMEAFGWIVVGSLLAGLVIGVLLLRKPSPWDEIGGGGLADEALGGGEQPSRAEDEAELRALIAEKRAARLARGQSTAGDAHRAVAAPVEPPRSRGARGGAPSDRSPPRTPRARGPAAARRTGRARAPPRPTAPLSERKALSGRDYAGSGLSWGRQPTQRQPRTLVGPHVRDKTTARATRTHARTSTATRTRICPAR